MNGGLLCDIDKSGTRRLFLLLSHTWRSWGVCPAPVPQALRAGAVRAGQAASRALVARVARAVAPDRGASQALEVPRAVRWTQAWVPRRETLLTVQTQKVPLLLMTHRPECATR